MRTRINAYLVLISLTGLMVYSACTKVTSPDEATIDVQLNNNSQELNLHVLQGESKKLAFTGTTEINSAYEFVLHATVSPLVWGDKVLHAVHVTLEGDYAYVAYATPENEYFGGIEIIEISDVSQPKILSQMIFTHSDITIALKSGNRLLLGGSANSDKLAQITSPAVFTIVELHDGLMSGDFEIFDLPSYNANDIMIIGESALVTTGTTGGGLAVFDLNTWDYGFIPIEGAKAIEVTPNGIYVMEGTGTNLHVYSALDTSFIETIPLGCPNIFQSKAETDVKDDLLFFSSGSCGMKAINTVSGEIIYDYPIPGGGHCNGVSVNNNLVFLANDTSGLALLEIDGGNLHPMGTLSFGASVNYVISQDNKLFVAAAEAGLKIIEIVPVP
ncbi:MAG: hypothetical protein H6696_17155 [Deferribacteres bacterium]|nr:hypothetical protein [candidate division KSB1 bacterium]MCB9503664.1 hypothetical protein [Deferribacteres bacterium]